MKKTSKTGSGFLSLAVSEHYYMLVLLLKSNISIKFNITFNELVGLALKTPDIKFFTRFFRYNHKLHLFYQNTDGAEMSKLSLVVKRKE